MTNSDRYVPDVADGLPPGPRPMIAVVPALPGHESALSEAIGTLAAAVRREPGCREFRTFRDAADPASFYLYEVYDDADAFRAHLATEHVAAFFTQLELHSTADASALVQLVEFGAARVGLN